MGNQFRLEPRILSQPAIVAPGGVRKRDDPTIVAPRAHRLADCSLCASLKVVSMRVCSDRQHEIKCLRRREEPVMPVKDTFRPGRTIGARLVVTGETKPHR